MNDRFRSMTWDMSRRIWRIEAIVASLVVAISALGNHFTHQIVFQAALLLGIVSMILGVKLNKPKHPDPWIIFAISMAIFSVSYGMRLFWPSLDPKASGAATPGEIIDTLGFITSVFAVHRMAQLRQRKGDHGTMIDALILTGGVTTVLWIGAIVPYAQNTSLALSGRLLGTLGSTSSIWLGFASVRLMIGPGVRSPASRLLAICACFGILSEVGTTATIASSEGNSVLIYGAFAWVFMSAAALNPSLSMMTQSAEGGISRMTRRRIGFMTLSVIVAPICVVAEVISHQDSLLPYLGLALLWVMNISFVMLRLGGLVRAREHVANVERALNRAAASLVAATDQTQTYAAALAAMTELAGTKVGELRTSLALTIDDDWRVVGSSGYGSELADGRRLNSTTMTRFFTDRDDNRPVQLLDALPFDNPESGPCVLVVAPLISQGNVRGALFISSATPIPAIALEAVTALASDISLAVEAANLSETLHRRRSEQRFRSLVDNSPDIIMVFSRTGRTTFASPAAERTFGSRSRSLDQVLQLVDERDLAIVQHAVKAAQNHQSLNKSVEFRFILDGDEHWFEATAVDMASDPEIDGIVVNARDISERKASEKERQLSEARFRSLVQHSSDLTIVLEADGTMSYIAPAIQPMLGYKPEHLIGKRIATIVKPEDAPVIDELVGLLVGGTASTNRIELRVQAAGGATKTLDVMLTDLRHDPSVNGIVMNAHDITDRKELEYDLRHKVLHDDLTGIANRVLFRDRVEHALQTRNENTDTVSAVLFIDIDDFKTINDGLGHDMGDELLKIVAFRLESFVRAGDTAARLGGDEFALLLRGLPGVEDALNAAQRLLALLNEPVEFDGRELNVSVSVGVALADSTVRSDELLRNADVAMYHAKQTGKNRVRLFDEAMYLSAFERLELKADLVHALERNELMLHYQPLIDLKTKELVGFEALMRWIHPTRGFVSPASFIPLAEETGLIVPMGEWALHTALGQLAKWREDGAYQIGMNVNMSPRQLEEADIVEQVERAIRETGVDPSWVTLELTESAGIVDDITRDRLVAMRNLGCKIAADDFGTGFASYAALQHLPFTEVKIDRSMIIGLSSGDPKAMTQVSSIVQMGRGLGLSIVAEGIEDERQEKALVELGADKGQGYLFGRPAAAAEAGELLKQYSLHE